jgi:hypothetical protein
MNMSMDNCGMSLTGENGRTRRNPFLNATSFTTNLTLIDLDANSGLFRERPVTNRLSHETAYNLAYFDEFETSSSLAVLTSLTAVTRLSIKGWNTLQEL